MLPRDQHYHSATIFIIFILLLGSICLSNAGFNNNPSSVSIHENNDASVVVWSYIDARCEVISFLGVTIDVTCDSCELQGNSGLFSISGKTVTKVTCQDAGCGSTGGTACSNSRGCLNAGESPSVTVRCYAVLLGITFDETTTLSLSVTANAAPTFSFRSGNSITVAHGTASGTVVNIIDATDSDSSIDGDSISYRLNSGPGPSWIHGNTLFGLDGANIKLIADLTLEFSNDYTMNLCAYDRRNDETCHDLDITVDACFETPTCNDQSTSIDETFSLHTGHGTTNKLFDMTYPAPSDHFPSISATWHQLEWEITSSDLSVASIGQYNGELTTTGNISVFPAYPSKVYTVVVEVSNPSESCYTTECTMTITVAFKNWDPEIVTLPASINIHEDVDGEVLINNITVYDYNDPDQDNVTCTLVSIVPDENNLFVVRHEDDMYGRHSWNLYRLRCQTPDCGYHSGNFLCTTNIGCLNYDVNNQYVLTVTCTDAYGASDTDTFTFNVLENQAPVWRNVPNSVTLDTDAVSDLDTIFSILYTDAESETLYYNYTYDPDIGIFAASSSGNFYNDLGNITMTVQLWNHTNSSFTVSITAHERRNQIHGDVTIILNEYCGPTPNCNSDTTSETVEFTVGDTLFSVAGLVDSPGQFTQLTYSMADNSPGYFSINSGTGAITTLKALTASYPSSTYEMHAFVYDVNACRYGTCPLRVTVTPVNYDLSITNMPGTVSIHEDETDSLQLFVITTADANTDDTVDCQITTITPATAAGSADLFYLTDTFPGSDMFMIMSRNAPEFTSATVQYTVDVSCEDSQGSSDTGTLTIDIELNIGPTFTNLDNTTSVTVDPAIFRSGALIYTVTATDTENDNLTYTCNVANTAVPLQCNNNYITLRRDVDIEDEHGVTYTIDMCVSDAKHTNSVCAQLSVLFSSSRTYPVFSNLPGAASVSEDAALGTTVFTISVTDPDVGDTHTFIFHDAVPTSGFTHFALNVATGEVTVNTALNYESQSTYELWFKVRDDHLLIHAGQMLTITVTDVNEGPTLIQGLYALTIGEDEEVGYMLADPLLNCTDPDTGDTLTLTISSGAYQFYFSLDSATGLISLAQVYDLESGLPSSTTIEITCTDGGSLTSTVAITIEITTINEFYPVLTASYPDPSNIINVYSNTSLLEDLLTISATDADVNNAGTFGFSILGDGHGAIHFRVLALTSSSVVLRITNYMSIYYDTNFTFTIKVADGDNPEKYSGYPVTVYYYAPTVPLPTKDYTWCLLCNHRGKILVGFFAAEGLILLLLACHCLVHFNRGKGAKVSKVKAMRLFGDHEPPEVLNKGQSSVDRNSRHNNRSSSPQEDSESDSDDEITTRERRKNHYDSILRPSFSRARLSQSVSPSPFNLRIGSPEIAATQTPPNVPVQSAPKYDPDVTQRPKRGQDSQTAPNVPAQLAPKYDPDVILRPKRGYNFKTATNIPAQLDPKYDPDVILRPKRVRDPITHLDF